MWVCVSLSLFATQLFRLSLLPVTKFSILDINGSSTSTVFFSKGFTISITVYLFYSHFFCVNLNNSTVYIQRKNIKNDRRYSGGLKVKINEIIAKIKTPTYHPYI